MAGPTASGKTSWIKRLLENSNTMIAPPPEIIVWFYKRWQPMYTEMGKTIPNIQFIQGIEDKQNDSKQPCIYIYDDLMRDATQNGDVCEIYTEGSHHNNLSIICLMQNLYYKGKESRTMSLNTQYLVLFKNPRDQQQVAVLARQMYPNKPKYLLNKFQEATSKPYGCLFVDLKQNTPDDERLKTNIFLNMKEEFKEEKVQTKDDQETSLTPTEINMHDGEQEKDKPHQDELWDCLVARVAEKGKYGIKKCSMKKSTKSQRNTYLRNMYAIMLMEEYRRQLLSMRCLKDSQYHQKIMRDVTSYESGGLDFNASLLKAIEQNKNLFFNIVDC